LGIWRNIGKIVILLYQIVYEQVKWTIRSFKRDTTKKSNTPRSELNNIQLSEQEESIKRSKVMLHQYEYEQVEWSENPFPKHSKVE